MTSNLKLKRLSANAEGFTLLELLVSVAISGIIIVIVMDFAANTMKSNAISTARDTLLSEAQIALDRINTTIRLSADADDNNRWADANAPGGSGSPYSWQSNSHALILATAAEDGSQNILFSDPDNYVTEKNNYIYFVSGGTLYRRILAAPVSGNAAVTSCPAASASSSCPHDVELLHNVASFNVTYIDGNGSSTTPSNARAVQLDLNLSRVQYNKTITANYTTRTVFRNE